ncbi:trigger factor, partial [Weissella sp. GP1]
MSDISANFFDNTVSQITVPGFRKGKMPKQVFFQMYG